MSRIRTVEIIRPGPPGDLTQAVANTLYPDKTATEAALARTDPGVAGSAGQYLVASTGGAPRWMAEPVFDVTHPRFGATGNGSTDDRAAIQSALDAVDAAGGGTVYLPAGTYALATKDPLGAKQCLTVHDSTRIIGAGMGATVIKAADSLATDSPIMQLDGRVDVEIAHLSVDGNKSRPNSGGEDEGINLNQGPGPTNCARVFIHHVHVYDCGQDGIDNDGCDGLFITDCVLENCNGLGSHNRGGGSGLVMIARTSCKNNGHERAISSAFSAAIDIQGAGPLIVSDCVLDGNASGIHISTHGQWLITNTWILQKHGPAATSGGHAIVSDDGYGVVSDCIIRIEATDAQAITATTNVHAVHIAGGTLFTQGSTVNLIDIDGVDSFRWHGTDIIRTTGTGQTGALIANIANRGWSVHDVSMILDTTGTTGLIVKKCGKGVVTGCSIHAVNALRVQGSSDVRVIGNALDGGSRAIRIENDPDDSTVSTNCVVIGNDLSGGSSSNQSIAGTGHTVRNNTGALSENRGTATITDTNTTVVVTHILGTSGAASGDRWTPTSVTVTPHGNEAVWVTSIGNQTFTINRSGSSGNLDVSWQAET